MALALNLRCGNATAEAIVSLWDRASVFEDSPSMRALQYAPHFTFAIYDASDVTEEFATAVMMQAAKERSAVEIAFNRIRTFADHPWSFGPSRSPGNCFLKCTARSMPQSIRRCAGPTTGRETGFRIARLRCRFSPIGPRMRWR
jgi:hypothetical protein